MLLMQFFEKIQGGTEFSGTEPPARSSVELAGVRRYDWAANSGDFCRGW